MNFLKNLFGGGDSGEADHGFYYYVQPRGCEEVVRVRIDSRNDLSAAEDGGYWVRKTVRGTHRCFNPAELTLYYDKNRNLTNHEVSGGKLVDEAAYQEWEAAFAAKKAAAREQNAAVDAANSDETEPEA